MLRSMRPQRPASRWAWLFAHLAAPALLAQAPPPEAAPSAARAVISSWRFDRDRGDRVLDEARGKEDPVFGAFAYVPGVAGKALKLDGFRTYVRREHDDSPPAGPFTVQGWVALASYPWSWAPVVDCSDPTIAGFFLGIGPSGNVAFRVAAGSSWHEARTNLRVPLRAWTHLAAVFEPDSRIAVFVNGEVAATCEIDGSYVSLRRGALTIGRTNTPRTWQEYQLTTADSHFFLDGLLDELEISGGARSEAELRRAHAAAANAPAPALSDRSRFPTGPRGDGDFGAFHARLDYYPEWDHLWRVSDVSDLFVRFERSPVQLVFWRGTSFVPCWVTENDIWYTNEWLETWGADVASCAEPIMDRQCRYSHVRLIENTAARIVVHWRYALGDAFQTIAAVTDDGSGEWCDEFHTIYPDQVGVRRMELHHSMPARKHDWVEQIVVLPPGRHPDDVVERGAVSLVNMAGDVHRYTWHDELPVAMSEPAGANISYVHLQSEYRPFFVLPPDPVDSVEGRWDSPFFRSYAAHMGRGYRPDPVPSVYGWWNHWPVAQIPGDGRWVTTPDKPSHFNLTTFVQWKDHEVTDRTRTRIMLQGMTDLGPDGLVPLARSWLRPPQMRLLSEGFGGGAYDPAERAYRVERTAGAAGRPCRLAVEASADSPIRNLAILVENWGQRSATVSIDCRETGAGVDVRQGIRRRPTSADLVLWVGLTSETPIEILVTPAGSER
ncbi:MAG: LamG domain-containing protein [Planctomycetes bacterium]|nr:LamG domain-containing protein [Planctomycetota bacterium]